MPGNTGDALYSLPTIRELYRQTGMLCDFYTSKLSSHLKRLFEYQDCIDRFIVAEDYRIEHRDMGTQPWLVPIEGAYGAVYHLGYKTWPDRMLHQFIAHQVGIDKPLAIRYNHPDLTMNYGDRSYIIIAPRSRVVNYEDLLYQVTQMLGEQGIISVVVGAEKESNLGHGHFSSPWIDNVCGLDFLEVAALMSKAAGFIGAISSHLAIANGFEIPRIAIYPGQGYDMRHVLEYHRNKYLANPSSIEVVQALLEGRNA
jgi:hypothetical protein